MGERSIAEIIGWAKSPLTLPGDLFNDGGEDVHVNRWTHPTIHGSFPRYTADDLLAWLDINVPTSWVADGRARFVGWGDFSMAAGFEHQHSAETFLAALEAAVRAVAASLSPTTA